MVLSVKQISVVGASRGENQLEFGPGKLIWLPLVDVAAVEEFVVAPSGLTPRFQASTPTVFSGPNKLSNILFRG